MEPAHDHTRNVTEKAAGFGLGLPHYHKHFTLFGAVRPPLIEHNSFDAGSPLAGQDGCENEANRQHCFAKSRLYSNKLVRKFRPLSRGYHPMFALLAISSLLLAGFVFDVFDGDDDGGDGSSEDTLSDRNDEFSGTDQADQIDGGAGDDELNGGKGFDTLSGGPGDDVINGGPGRDVLEGDSGDDFLDGGSWNDTIGGGAGNDTLSGGRGIDVLLGNDGDDELNGGAWDDFLLGGDGSDILNGGAGSDVLNGGFEEITKVGVDQGVDVSAETAAALEKLSEDDPDFYDEATLEQLAADPRVPGLDLTERTELGFDTLNGGEGNDRLLLGAGDIGIGGSGNDEFVLSTAINTDPAIIQDYDAQEDVITVSYNAEDGVPNITIASDDDDAILRIDGTDIARVVGAAGTINPFNVIPIATSFAA